MVMCREGTDETIVTLTTDTGVTVSRIRSKKRNAYILDGQAYDAVKTDVPLEVQTALGIHMATLGPRIDEMLNVSRQMDAPFMLGSSGGDAAKVLGNLCGITTLDAALAGLRPDLTSIKRELDAVDKLEKAYHVALPEFAHLAAEEKHLDEIRDYITHAQQVSARIEKLQEIKAKIGRYKETVNGIDARIDSLRETLKAEMLVKQADHLQDRINQLVEIEEKMKLVTAAYKTADETITKTKLKIATLQNHYDQTLSDAGSEILYIKWGCLITYM
jgi:DNA repair exonuclease SbcCD ATPase subunit